MKVSFRQLSHAIALANRANFRLAAADLHISQPALTRSIKALEESLSVELFDRLSSGVELTPAGKVFLERGRRVLQEGEDMERALSDFLGLATGSLVVSTGPYPGDALVPDAMAALMRLAPDLSCRIWETDWKDVPEQLLSRESDLAIAELSDLQGDERFQTEVLVSDRLYFVCRRDHPLAAKAQIKSGDFGEYPLVGNRVPDRVMRTIGIANAQPGGVSSSMLFRCKIDVSTFAATKRIVLASDGITLAPLVQVAQELRKNTMTVLKAEVPAIHLHSGLIHLKARSLSPVANQFVKELRRTKQQMDEQSAALKRRYEVVQ
ncbi:MAG: LysR family transcriptional regulator [Pseudomonadota bacterium]